MEEYNSKSGYFVLFLDSGEGYLIKEENIDVALDEAYKILQDLSDCFGAFYYVSLDKNLVIDINTKYFDRFTFETKSLNI